MAAANAGAAPADRAPSAFRQQWLQRSPFVYVRLGYVREQRRQNLLNNGHCASRYKDHVWPHLCIRLAGCSFSCWDGTRRYTGRQPLTLAAKGTLRKPSVVRERRRPAPSRAWQAIAGLLSFWYARPVGVARSAQRLVGGIACRPAFHWTSWSPIRGCRTSFCGNNFHQAKF